MLIILIIAGTIMMPFVVILASTVGILGGALAATGNLPAGIAMWKAACTIASGAITGGMTGAGLAATIEGNR